MDLIPRVLPNPLLQRQGPCEKRPDDFMDGLDSPVIKGITKFFETAPKLRHEMKYTNSNGDEKTFVVEGMRSFFT